jgi:hypothetical protein
LKEEKRLSNDWSRVLDSRLRGNDRLENGASRRTLHKIACDYKRIQKDYGRQKENRSRFCNCTMQNIKNQSEEGNGVRAHPA